MICHFIKLFAGGYGSKVRGYRESTLGPRSPAVIYAGNPAYAAQCNVDPEFCGDPDPEAIGGNALIQAGAELVLPVPFKGDWARQLRPVVFVEGGQVYNTEAKDFEISTDKKPEQKGQPFVFDTALKFKAEKAARHQGLRHEHS